MEPEILKYRLKKNYLSFLKDLEPRKLLDYLYQEEIFDEDDMDEVRAERTRKHQAEKLLSMLSQKDIQGYAVFLDALSEIQPHLAKILRSPISEEKIEYRAEINSQPTYSEEIKYMLEKLKLHSQPTEHGHTHLQVSDFCSLQSPVEGRSANVPQDQSDFVKPTNWDLISQMYRPHSLESVYKMTSNPRGLALIVNVYNFDENQANPAEGLKKREGTIEDVEQLLLLFTSLNFETKELIDLPKDELLSTLGKISTYDFSKQDCFVLCIMSHGKDNYFYARDGGKIEINEVLKMFNNSHCKTLCGKPKLYFIQACRGKATDFGTIVQDGPSANPTENEEPQKLPEKPKYSFDVKHIKGPSTGEHADQLVAKYSFYMKSIKGPSTGEHVDQLVAYSSVEGYSSFRHTHTGSRFIQSLVDVFREYACMEDVLSMMTRVIRKVNSQGEIGKKQVPKPETTLTRKVFFWPGITFDDQ